jgi:hypothetical protein
MGYCNAFFNFLSGDILSISGKRPEDAGAPLTGASEITPFNTGVF